MEQKGEEEEFENMSSLEEQQLLVSQINRYKPNEYHEMLGVSTMADETEIKEQYKKLALLIHPDKNKAKGAIEAFHKLKKAYEMILNGVDPAAKDVKEFSCPNSSCGTTIYMNGSKYKIITRGTDIGVCKSCKIQFGQIYCTHCFSSWMMSLKPELSGSLIQCSICKKQFVMMYPKPQPQHSKVNYDIQPKKAVKRKRNWWETIGQN